MRIIPGRAAGCADFYHHRTIKPQAYTAGGFFHICRRRLQRGFAMEVGALRRFNHIINPQTGRAIIVPMDHGVSDGAPRGLRDMAQAVQDMDEGMADAVLLHKGLIREAGRKEALGRPILYATTDRFLEHFGISDIRELPPLPSAQEKGDEPLTP